MFSQAFPEETSLHNLLTTQPFRKSRKVWKNVKETVVSDAGHGVAEMFVQCFTTMQKYQIYCERLQVPIFQNISTCTVNDFRVFAHF